MSVLLGKVALVTGGTRNVGKGIALGLGEAGATVYVTGRTIRDKDVKAITEMGGQGFAVVCDHEEDAEVKAVFDRIAEEQGGLDILVNNAWAGYQRLRNRKENKGFRWKAPFWEQPIALWDEMQQVGVRSNFVAATHATQLMSQNSGGLIVNISFYASRRYYGNVFYGVAKAAVDKMTADMSTELRKMNVACVSLYPGYITDKKATANPKKESAQFVGRAVAALAADPHIMSKSGEILEAARLAGEYGFYDVDGTQPEPFATL